MFRNGNVPSVTRILLKICLRQALRLFPDLPWMRAQIGTKSWRDETVSGENRRQTTAVPSLLQLSH